MQGEPRSFFNLGKGVGQYPQSNQGIVATEGTPLVYNHDGLVYGEHNNFSLQFSSAFGFRDFFSAYVEPILLMRQNTGDLENFDDTKMELLKGYGKLTFWGAELEGGRDSMWWGQGAHGDIVMTNNAFPLDMIKLSNPEPILLPWIFQSLGPFKYTIFASQLTGYDNPSDPWLGGLRINFKPHPLFEMGLSSTLQFNGEGVPRFNFIDIFRFFGAKSATNANQLAAFDFRLRLPFLMDAQAYMEYGGEDSGGWDPEHPAEIVVKDNAWMFGIYFPRLTFDGRTDLRVEYTLNSHRVDDTPGFWYGHSAYRSGYVHDDIIMGHHMGPDAEDLFTRVSYYLKNNVQVGLDYDWMMRGMTLNTIEERVNQYGADLTVSFYERALCLITRYGFETVDNYDMQLGDNRRNHLFETVVKVQF